MLEKDPGPITLEGTAPSVGVAVPFDLNDPLGIQYLGFNIGAPAHKSLCTEPAGAFNVVLGSCCLAHSETPQFHCLACEC